MSTDDYAPLWCKSNCSFLEGASHPEELVDEAHRLGLRSIALTDRDGVYGMVRAHTKARDLGMRVIAGAQVTIGAPGVALTASPVTVRRGGGLHANDGSNDGAGDARPGRGPGWGADTDALAPEVPVTNRRGRTRRAAPRQVTLDEAARAPTVGASTTLVLLATDRAGWTNLVRLLTAGRRRCDKGDSLVTWTESLRARGGPRRARGRRRQRAGGRGRLAAGRARRAARGLRRSAVRARHAPPPRRRHRPRGARAGAGARGRDPRSSAATEVLYHSRSRRQLQDVLTCIRHGVTLTTAGRRIRGNDEHDLRPPHAFGKLFGDELAAVARTLEIASRCQFSLAELRYRYPSERLPDGTTSAQYLRALTYAGAGRRYHGPLSPALVAQLDTELAIIEDLDYPGYFLTMHELVSYCARKNILCQGRGSAANSAVCYCLGITAVDPVAQGLLFERFLSRERAEPPDIDLDIEHERREEVIQHVYGVYGRDHAAMVCNFIRYRPKSAVRDAGKALGIPETALDRAAKQLSAWGGLEPDVLAQAGLTEDAGRGGALVHLTKLADELLEFPRHLSVHPGGFLLGHEPVHDIVPIENASMPGRTVIQWDKNDIEDLGLFKVDLLALGALHQLHLAFDLLRAHRGLDLTMAAIPHDDPATYAMIRTADTVGTFQIESRAQMSMLPRLKPEKFYDLVVEVSIVRPGPIAGGMVHPYLRRKAGLEPVTYPHPSLEPVLARTLGVPMFQEQVMRLAMVAADYTPGEADQLRRDMAAWRSTGRIEQHRDRLISRMEQKGIAREFGERVFEQIRGFGEYGFPESHATSFALIAYVTCYLRCHYFPEFTCALLNAQPMGFYSVATIVGDARRHGLEVLPIDVMASEWDCTLEPHAGPGGFPTALRMGLRWIKGLQQRDGEVILAARRVRAFDSLGELVRRTGIAGRVHTALAEAGALGALSPSRRDALWQVAGWTRRQDDALPVDADASGDVAFAPLTPLDTIFWDYRASDHSPRGHPLEPLRRELTSHGWPDARALALGARDGARAEYVGIVICRQQPGTAGGVVFMTLEDETGFVNLVVWQQVYAEHRQVLRASSLLGVTGKLQVNEGIVHLIADRLWTPALSRPVVEVDSRDFH